MCSDSPSKQYEALARKIRRGSTIRSKRASLAAAGRVRRLAKTLAEKEMSARTRSVEAFFACVMVSFGIIFTIPGETLSLKGWALMRSWTDVFPGTEWGLGFILMLVGTVRICALIINGKWYPTPIARLIGCLVGSLFWTSCAVSFLSEAGGTIPTHLAWDLSAIAFEWFSASRAAADMRVMDSLGLHAKASGNARPGSV